MIIHYEGYRVIPWILLILVLLNGLVFLATGYSFVFWLILTLSISFLLMNFWFFREPGTVKKGAPGEVISSADGKIVVIEPVRENEYFGAERMQISVFMSLLNVHINHVPVEGEIVYQKHHKGRFLPANLAKSSGENERCTTVIRTPMGEDILVRQVAGILARKIVTYKKTGEKVSLSDQLGFIRFGSRVDIFLPVTAEVGVQMNQEVKGGITVLGHIK